MRKIEFVFKASDSSENKIYQKFTREVSERNSLRDICLQFLKESNLYPWSEEITLDIPIFISLSENNSTPNFRIMENGEVSFFYGYEQLKYDWKVIDFEKLLDGKYFEGELSQIYF